jgi:hypothetical protein
MRAVLEPAVPPPFFLRRRQVYSVRRHPEGRPVKLKSALVATSHLARGSPKAREMYVSI